MINCEGNHSLAYLNINERPILSEDSFDQADFIFRLKPDKNPIDLAYPSSTITELSCNWSKFIIPGDIVRLRPGKGEFIFYSSVKKVRKFAITLEKNDGNNYDGTHSLSCYIYHAPLENDYSHMQIDILHQLKTEIPEHDETIRYTKSNWKKGGCILTKKATTVKKFFKDLREEYKFQLAQEFELLPSEKHFLLEEDFLSNNPEFQTKQRPNCIIEFITKCILRKKDGDSFIA